MGILFLHMCLICSFHEHSQVDPKLIELECRQELILQELKSLENEVACLASKLKPAAATSVAPTGSSSSAAVKSRSTDLVIGTNTDFVLQFL